MLQYGVPLDDRADFTKTDWLMWVAAMGNKEQVKRPSEMNMGSPFSSCAMIVIMANCPFTPSRRTLVSSSPLLVLSCNMDTGLISVLSYWYRCRSCLMVQVSLQLCVSSSTVYSPKACGPY